MPRPLPNRIGRRHGSLVVMAKGPTLPSGVPSWRCKCDCGGRRLVGNDKMGRATSCLKCVREHRVAPHRTHGQNGTPTYFTWQKMKSRCYNRRNNRYRYYGAEGIRVCKRWHKFENFLADMGHKPSRTATLERKNGKKSYGPRNCIWLDRALQSGNRRITVWVTLRNGDRVCMAEACRRIGAVSRWVAYSRVRDLGWSPERAAYAPSTRLVA